MLRSLRLRLVVFLLAARAGRGRPRARPDHAVGHLVRAGADTAATAGAGPRRGAAVRRGGPEGVQHGRPAQGDQHPHLRPADHARRHLVRAEPGLRAAVPGRQRRRLARPEARLDEARPWPAARVRGHAAGWREVAHGRQRRVPDARLPARPGRRHRGVRRDHPHPPAGSLAPPQSFWASRLAPAFLAAGAAALLLALLLGFRITAPLRRLVGATSRLPAATTGVRLDRTGAATRSAR